MRGRVSILGVAALALMLAQAGFAQQQANTSGTDSSSNARRAARKRYERVRAARFAHAFSREARG